MAIDSEDIDRLKEIFVSKNDCENKHDKVESQINENKTTVAVINNKLNWLIAILATIATCLLPLAINSIIGG